VGGIAVDATLGGILRLKGSGGGLRDVVELGANGLLIGGATAPVNLSSPITNILRIGRGILLDGLLQPLGTEPVLPPSTRVLGWEQDRGPVIFAPNSAGTKNIRFDLSWSAHSEWRYQTSTAAGDPGAGNFRLNKGSVNALNAVYISKTDANGDSFPNLQQAWAVSGSFIVSWPTPRGRLDAFITSVTDNVTYITLGIDSPQLSGDWGVANDFSTIYTSSISGGAGGRGGSVTSPGCIYLAKSATQSVATGTSALTLMSLVSSGIVYDPDGFADVNNNRLVVPAGMAGYYEVWGDIEWAANAAGARRWSVRVNGVNTVQSYLGAVINQTVSLPLSTRLYLNVGDTIELYGAHSVGSNLIAQTKSLGCQRLWA